jgi:hypothetical protein
MDLTHTSRLRLLAGRIANLNWTIDKMWERGCNDFICQPYRDELNRLLARYQRGREYFDCSAPEYVSDEEVDIWEGFYFNCED